MQLASIIERIDTQMPTLNQVTAAATVPLAITALTTYPAACVVLPRGTAGKNSPINAIRQRVDDTFAVILAVRNVKDMTGKAAAAEIDALKPLLIAAMLGWVINEDYAPIEYAGHQLIAYQDGLLFWAEHFKSSHYVSAALSY